MSYYKTWGGLTSCPRKGAFEGCDQVQHRCLIRAMSQRRAVELAREHLNPTTTLGYLRAYFSVTGNSVELGVVAGMQEGIWIMKGASFNSTPDDYVRIV